MQTEVWHHCLGGREGGRVKEAVVWLHKTRETGGKRSERDRALEYVRKELEAVWALHV